MRERLEADDTRDVLRKLGGLLLGLGFLMWWLRKQDALEGDLVLFVILAAPATLLYGLGTFTQGETGGLRPWQAVYSVFGLILVPLALVEFANMVGDPGDGENPLNLFWIFGVTAALGFYAGLVAGIRWQLLAGSIALIVSWSALWDEILSDGITAHYGIYRGLLGILSIALLAGGLYLWRTNPGPDAGAASATDVAGDRGLWRASELLTGAGIAAVIACGLGIASFASETVALTDAAVPRTSTFWDILLLVVSLGLVALGAQIGLRGPVYVGAVGLALFLFIVGGDLDEDDPDPTKFGVWPLVLLILGALGIALSAVKEASQGDKPRRLIDQIRGR